MLSNLAQPFGLASRRSRRLTLPVTHRAIPSDVVSTAEKIAAQMGVSPLIHDSDFIFWADYDRLGGNAFESVSNYFKGGQETAADIISVLSPHQQRARYNLLDFAAGYSRVARHFHRQAPKINVTVADIHPDAVSFARRLRMKAKLSTWAPAEFKPGLFDAIVAVSFFTHMPREDWQAWLAALSRSLAKGGVLLFTTHGHPALKPMGITEEPEDGFGYYQQSEQRDLSLDRYATTLTLPRYVRTATEAVGLEVLDFRESGFGYQDLWIVRRKTSQA